jgi:hypothetical protein
LLAKYNKSDPSGSSNGKAGNSRTFGNLSFGLGKKTKNGYEQVQDE